MKATDPFYIHIKIADLKDVSGIPEYMKLAYGPNPLQR
jgi:hypothetical protein